ncbi:hypothetical protein BJY01DRAFT_248101 [Aspergillus pseudoustus]|uniref:Activator of Hsp90 ATPase n=1 Tax=Aspergillus pseudoustus TaxID=1810923 RepID=A0ABR4JXT4_9EURO
MILLTTSIEINAPPAVVREKFLDFPSIPKYTTGFVHSITPTPAKPPASLIPGDKLACVMGNMNFSPIVVENEPSIFSWRGSLPGVFTGEHVFRFEELDGGKRTRLVHEEKFNGLLAGLMGEGWMSSLSSLKGNTLKGFEGYNQDFKRWVEGGDK